MWEVTLIGKPSDLIIFLELKHSLKTKLGRDIIAVITFEKNLVFSIATSNPKFKKIIEREIFGVIIRIAKLDFYMDKLLIFKEEKSLNTYLISNLVNMGLLDEVDYAINICKLSLVVHIRSFVRFKLNNLYQMWQNDVSYYNKYLSDNCKEKYVEFLKIIATTSQNKLDILYIIELDNSLTFLDSKKNVLKSLKKGDDIGIISSLLLFSPKKIIINCIESLSSKMTNLISYIFEDRVSVLL